MHGPPACTALPLPALLGWATVGVELAGGLVIVVGAFVPLAATPMIAVLLVPTFTVHPPNGFSSIKLLAYDALGAHSAPAHRRRGCRVSAP